MNIINKTLLVWTLSYIFVQYGHKSINPNQHKTNLLTLHTAADLWTIRSTLSQDLVTYQGWKCESPFTVCWTWISSFELDCVQTLPGWCTQPGRGSGAPSQPSEPVPAGFHTQPPPTHTVWTHSSTTQFLVSGVKLHKQFGGCSFQPVTC